MSRSLRFMGFRSPESKSVGVPEQPKDGPVKDINKKLLRDVVIYWLYSKDKDVLLAAAIELRRRLKHVFPKPEWMRD